MHSRPVRSEAWYKTHSWLVYVDVAKPVSRDEKVNIYFSQRVMLVYSLRRRPHVWNAKFATANSEPFSSWFKSWKFQVTSSKICLKFKTSDHKKLLNYFSYTSSKILLLSIVYWGILSKNHTEWLQLLNWTVFSVVKVTKECNLTH